MNIGIHKKIADSMSGLFCGSCKVLLEIYAGKLTLQNPDMVSNDEEANNQSVHSIFMAEVIAKNQGRLL